MALTSLAQIKGGTALQNDVNILKASYSAVKVITTIEKTAAAGTTPASYYNVDELLAFLKNSLTTVTTDLPGSIQSIQNALNEISNKTIKDVVRIELNAEYANNNFTVAPDDTIDSRVLNIDKMAWLPVYTLDNQVVYDTNGDQLKYRFQDSSFSGSPAELDINASKNATNDELIFKAYLDSFSFKVFPVGVFTLENLPESSLLDNDELELLSYDKIIKKIIVELAKDGDIIDAITDKVGAQTIADQIAAITDALALRIKALEDADYIQKSSIATTIPAVADASDEKVLSEKAAASLKESLESAIANAGHSDDYVKKIDVLQYGLIECEALPEIGEANKVYHNDNLGFWAYINDVWVNITQTEANAILNDNNIRSFNSASDDKVVSEKLLAKRLDSINASIANISQGSIGNAVSWDDVVSSVSALNDASDEKVVTEKAIATVLNSKLDKSLVWNPVSNCFYTKKTNPDGSFALVFNESDGGGVQYYNQPADIISYVGVNSDGDENDAANDTSTVCVQLYSKYKDGNKSNSALNSGVRIAINPQKAYYTKGTNTAANGGSEDNEIAVVGQIKALENVIDENFHILSTALAGYNNSVTVDDKIDLSSASPDTVFSTFTLSETPNSELVQMFFGGAVYFEGDEFTVDRTTKQATWTFTAENDGLDITNDVTPFVRFRYKKNAD